MKKWLICSIAANLVFCLIGIHLTVQPKTEGRLARPPLLEGVSQRTTRQPPIVRPGTNEAPASFGPGCLAAFRWVQLESTDYRTYIRNLRAIGCPEQTIRDIIVADVHALFAKREGRQVGVPWQQLSSEEVAVITALLGAQDGEGGPVAASTVQRLPSHSRLQETNVVMPLAFQELKSPMQLTSQQAQAINWLRQAFRTALGPKPDPNDPAYVGQWLEAQRASDAMMRGLLGQEFSMRYKMKLQEEQQGQ